MTYNTMPVKLTGRALGQVLLGSGNVVAGRKILDDLLANPAAVEDPRLGVGEAPFEVGDDPVVRRLPAKAVGVGLIPLRIGTAFICVSTYIHI
jgi:CHASE2 domain-containing sensor protein